MLLSPLFFARRQEADNQLYVKYQVSCGMRNRSNENIVVPSLKDMALENGHEFSSSACVDRNTSVYGLCYLLSVPCQ